MNDNPTPSVIPPDLEPDESWSRKILFYSYQDGWQIGRYYKWDDEDPGHYGNAQASFDDVIAWQEQPPAPLS